jgi:hypothetical protein
MLKDELRRIAPMRTALKSKGCPLAVLTAYLPAASVRDALLAELPRLGLRAELRGNTALICPTPALGRTLEALSLGCGADADLPLPALKQIYPQPAQLCGEHAALLREFRALPNGFDADGMALIARGLRLAEGPRTSEDERIYQTEVRQAAALALRLDRPGGALRACAYIIAVGGMKYAA